MAKSGRPSLYTPELAARICERLAGGESLRAICKSEDMPAASTVARWLADKSHPEFQEQYAHARDVCLDLMADEIIEIANTPQPGVKKTIKPTGEEVTEGDMIDHRRLQVDARKWYLSKLAPKRYGDRAALELSGPEGGSIELNDATASARLAAILATAAARKAGDDVGDLV